MSYKFILFNYTKQLFFIVTLMLINYLCTAQNAIEKCKKAITTFENKSYMQSGLVALTIMDAQTGKIIYSKNGHVGLPMASTQKVITAITAYEKLGANYTYKTDFITNHYTTYDKLEVKSRCDPTLGSDRYYNTTENYIFSKLKLSNKVMFYYEPSMYDDVNAYSRAWTLEDIGTYYGTGAYLLNWKENTFNIYPYKYNDEQVEPSYLNEKITMQYFLTNAPNTATADSNFVYYHIGDNNIYKLFGYCKNQDDCKIKAGIKGEDYFALSLKKYFKIQQQAAYVSSEIISIDTYRHYSPSLDSITYYFLQKSINLYGESLIKTIGYSKSKGYSREDGIVEVNKLYKKINPKAVPLDIFDGCGLSPQNRISCIALCQFLYFAKGKNYYNNFYNNLPEINGIKMKSGSIHGVKAYTGFVGNAANPKYIFAITAQNYSPNTKGINQELWKILDNLK